MKSFLRCLGVAFAFAASAASAQQPYGAYHFLFPYNGSNNPPFPFDVSKAAVGATPAEACGKLTAFEYAHFHITGALHPLVYTGILPSGACGIQRVNITPDPDVLVTVGLVTPNFAACSAFAHTFDPQWVDKPRRGRKQFETAITRIGQHNAREAA